MPACACLSHDLTSRAGMRAGRATTTGRGAATRNHAGRYYPGAACSWRRAPPPCVRPQSRLSGALASAQRRSATAGGPTARERGQQRAQVHSAAHFALGNDREALFLQDAAWGENSSSSHERWGVEYFSRRERVCEPVAHSTLRRHELQRRAPPCRGFFASGELAEHQLEGLDPCVCAQGGHKSDGERRGRGEGKPGGRKRMENLSSNENRRLSKCSSSAASRETSLLDRWVMVYSTRMLRDPE